jgi:uncharacterized protein (TIGR02466 family)
MMIHQLFPTPVYTDQNVDLLSNARSLFDLAKDQFFTTENGLKTTLKEYGPIKAVTPFDPLKLMETTPLKMYFRNSVERYLKETGYDNYEVDITNIWLNEMNTESSHTPHSHYGYTFSGSYYVDLPANSDKVVFHSFQEAACRPTLNHIKEYNSLNSLAWAMKVFPGTVVIFPANLRHSVPKMNFEGTRRVIAFDAVCKPMYVEKTDV